MRPKEALAQAKKNLEAARKHHDSIIEKIENQIKARQDAGLQYNDLEEELARAQSVKEGVLELSKANLKKAQDAADLEEQEGQRRQSQQSAEAEAKTKAQAQKNYISAGGKAEDFEAAWNNGLRDKVLESAVVNNKAEEKPVTVVQKNGF